MDRDEQMQPRFVNFQNFAQGLVFPEERLSFRPGIPKPPPGGISPGL